MQRATANMWRGLRPITSIRRTVLIPPSVHQTFSYNVVRHASRVAKPVKTRQQEQPDPVTGLLPTTRKGTIQPNDPIDLFDWPSFRNWTQLETNAFNIAQRFVREWKFFLPEVMTIANTEEQDEFEFLPDLMKLACDPKITKEFIMSGNFAEIDEEIRPLFTALMHIADLGSRQQESRTYVKQFSSELLRLIDFPSSWKMETHKEIDMQLGKVVVPGGDVDRIIFDDKGRVVMGMLEHSSNPSERGYLELGHHSIMGYALAYCCYNFSFPPEGESQEPQEQEVFFWNVKNEKVGLIRVNARLSVLNQLKDGQCPQVRTALCVWPMLGGNDFYSPEERKKFFICLARIKKYLESGKALIGPKTVDPVEKARLAAEAAAEQEAALKRKPTFLAPGQSPSEELLKALAPESPPSPAPNQSSANTPSDANTNKPV